MITTAERANRLSGGSGNQMKPNDFIAFIIKEAQHRVINDERSKNAESALAAHSKRTGKGKAGKKKHDKHSHSYGGVSDEVCENCGKTGHRKLECWSKGEKVEAKRDKAQNKRDLKRERRASQLS